MNIVKLPYSVYIDMIKANKPFSFSRFGDGEILCCFHSDWLHKNCDGSKFSDELIEPMKDIFRNRYDYFHCLLACSFDPSLKKETDQFYAFINEVCPKLPFFDGDIWQDMSFSGNIEILTNVLSPYNPCFIGGKHLTDNIALLKGLGIVNTITIPSVDSFSKFDEILNQIMDCYDQGLRMFCFSAGFTTKPLIDYLFHIIGHDSFLIDFGSVFDPYCGKLSRSGMVAAGFGKFQPYTNLKLK